MTSVCYDVLIRWYGPTLCDSFGPFKTYDEARKCAECLVKKEKEKFSGIQYIVIETYPADYMENPGLYLNKQLNNEYVYNY
jgi:hypothetical protein